MNKFFPIKLFIFLMILSACSSDQSAGTNVITKLHLESSEIRNLMPPQFRYSDGKWSVFLGEREPTYTWRKKISSNLIDFKDTIFSRNEAIDDFNTLQPESFLWKIDTGGTKWLVEHGPDYQSINFLQKATNGSTVHLGSFRPEIQWGETWKHPSAFATGIQSTDGEEYYILTVTGENPSGRPFTTTHYFIGALKDGYFIQDNKKHAHGYLDHGKDFFGGRFIFSERPKGSNPIIIGIANNEAYIKDLPTTLGVRLNFPRKLLVELSVADGWSVKQQPIDDLREKISQVIESPGDLTGIQHAWIELKVPTAGTEETGITLFKTARQELRIGYSPLSKTIFIDRTRSGKTDFNPLFASIDRMRVHSETKWIEFQILLDGEIVELFADEGKSVMTSIFFPEEPYGKAEWFGTGKLNQISGFILKP